jgi:hypothetical protein
MGWPNPGNGEFAAIRPESVIRGKDSGNTETDKPGAKQRNIAMKPNSPLNNGHRRFESIYVAPQKLGFANYSLKIP